MASTKTRTRQSRRSSASSSDTPPADASSSGPAITIDDRDHPAYLDGIYADPADDPRGFTPHPDSPFPLPEPFPGPLPDLPLPIHPDRPIPIPPLQPLPLKICGPVSGRYSVPFLLPPLPAGNVAGPLVPMPHLPPILRQTRITVRVDVDRFHPQNRISIEASRLFPSQRAHAIAVVTSDACLGIYRRRIEASITYRDGVDSLIPGVRLIFEASRAAAPFAYGSYQLTLIEASGRRHVHPLNFTSQYFDEVEFEVDQVSNASPVVTSYDTGSHPNRPATLPAETINLQTTFRRAGFDARISPNSSVIPVSGAGANGTWSDAEMHNAMVTFWSRFANLPQWAMWVLYAARHDMGRGLGGIMFDDIGANHRQGTAIFTDSFIVDVPAGDANPVAWRNRSVYWTAVHEMGHAFNLAHSWQKALGRPQVDGDPWIPLANEPEARSFMNYPSRVAGGQQAFFANFEFRFSNNELIFMRHAPRRFVQMGNENWFENHGFEQDPDQPAMPFKLHLRPNRERNSFDFLEPVKLELKLENVSGSDREVEEDAIADGAHVAILVRRDGGDTRKWRPFATYCHDPHYRTLKPGEALYASHFVAASGDGWLIDEPGFYTIQAACDLDGLLVVSNPLRIFVGTPDSEAEETVAPDFFSEDVARVLAFRGAPDLEKANDVLREVVERMPDNPAAAHAAVALAEPMTRSFKHLDGDGARKDMEIKATPPKPEAAARTEAPALVARAAQAAETLGHIDYREAMETLSGALAEAGDDKQAVKVQQTLIDTMEKRGVLKSVIAASRKKLDRMSAK